jgi:trimeric autotransporter adhesin
MKKFYLFLILFGTAFIATSIPNIGKKINLILTEIEKEKSGQKPIDIPKKAYTKSKFNKAKKSKFGVVSSSISAVQTVAVQGGGNAVPGGQLNYSFFISNAGGDATNVTFTDQLIADLTLVAGSVKATPIAQDNTYQSVGNVGITVPTATGILANDISPDNTALSATAGTFTGSQGGTFVIAADGSFTYINNPGYTGGESYVYTLNSANGTSTTGTININVTNTIWFIDGSYASGSSNGTLAKPFTTINAFQAINNATNTNSGENGDMIYVYDGAYTASDITLRDNQKLFGESSTNSFLFMTGIATFPYTNVTPLTNSSSTTTIANTTTTPVILGSGNHVQGFTNISSTTATTMTGLSVGALKIKDASLTSTAGQALQITAGGTLDVQFKSIASAGAAKGISVNNSTGSFQVLGTGSAGSGGLISSKTARGVEFVNCSNITLANMNFTNANTNDGTNDANDNGTANGAIYANGVTGLTINNSVLNGTMTQNGIVLKGVNGFSFSNGSISAAGNNNVLEAGINAMNLQGICSINNSTFSNGYGRNVLITQLSTPTPLALSVSNSTLQNPTLADNLEINTFNTTISTLNVTGSAFNAPITFQIQGLANNSSQLDVNVKTSTFEAGSGTAGGIELSSNNTAALKFNIVDNPQIESNGTASVYAGAKIGSTAEGRINNNTISSIGACCSPVYLDIDGNPHTATATMKVQVTNNILNITNVNNFDFGIFARNVNGTSAAKMDATITNNTINLAGSNQFAGIYTTVGVSSDANVVCENIAGNTVNGLSLGLNFAHYAEASSGTVINLQRNAGAGTNAQGIWVNNGNLPTTAGLVDQSGTINVAAGGCLTPSNPAFRIGVDEILVENVPVILQEEKVEENAKEEEEITLSGINTDFGVNKNLISNSNTSTNSNTNSNTSGTKTQSGETITINGSGSGFSLPFGKSTTITFSATISATPSTCNITNVASVSGSNISPTVNSNTTSVPLEIGIPQGPTISASEVCFGGSIILNGLCEAGGTLKWFDAATGGTQLGTGTFTLTNITTNTPVFASCTVGGCEGNRTSLGTIAVNALPDATITADATVCQFGTANLSVSNAGLASVLWSGTGVVDNTVNPTTAKPIYIGNLSYDVYVTDVNGCTATASKQVMVNPTPLVTAGADQTVCEDTQVTLQGNCIYNIYGTLSGAAEVPANNSAGKGMVSGYYDANANTLVLTLFYSGLSGTANNAHIHGPAAAGANNGVLQGLTAFTFGSNSGSYSQTFTNVSFGAAIIAGETYVNIHSTAFGGGELRAQLTAVCSGDEFTWNPGNLAGLSVNVTPPLPQETYTLTAKNSVTGCENNTPATVTISVDPVTLPSGPTNNTQNVANVQLIANACEYVARVVPTSLGFTDATVKSFVEMTPPYTYVPRHFQITPATNANTATGNITLFFSQADFNAYNGTIASNFFPTLPGDNAGIANIQIVKIPDGGGSAIILPNNGADWNSVPGYFVVWNTALEIWEVTFPVVGFSEFYAKSAATPLPITLISFTGKATEKGNQLNWKTANEKAFSHFEIQRSENAKKFDSIGKVDGNKSENYQFVDNQATGVNYYRLKMIDLDGKYNYSKTISIENSIEKSIVGNFYPNPTSGKVYVDVNATEKGNWNITTYDVVGKIVNTETRILQKGTNKVALEKLNLGVNFVKFETEKISEIRKIIKN